MTLTDRENSIIIYALHRFMSQAYARMDEAAQDKYNFYFKPGDVDAFSKDAWDAKLLIAKLQENKK